MTLNLSVPGQNDLRPRISVFGIGGAGGNAVNNMIEKQLEGAEFVAANTDAQALQQSNAKNKIQMGVKVTEGLGAGARASVGAAAAEETIDEIVDHLAGSHMAFITAGMGGGTGTGAAPIIAQAARELGVLTVGVVTKPFQFEGAKRMRQAEEGVEALQKVVDQVVHFLRIWCKPHHPPALHLLSVDHVLLASTPIPSWLNLRDFGYDRLTMHHDHPSQRQYASVDGPVSFHLPQMRHGAPKCHVFEDVQQVQSQTVVAAVEIERNHRKELLHNQHEPRESDHLDNTAHLMPDAHQIKFV